MHRMRSAGEMGLCLPLPSSGACLLAAGPCCDLVGDERRQPALPQSAPRLEHAANTVIMPPRRRRRRSNHLFTRVCTCQQSAYCSTLSARYILSSSYTHVPTCLQQPCVFLLLQDMSHRQLASRLAIFVARHRHHSSSSPRPCCRRCIPERLIWLQSAPTRSAKSSFTAHPTSLLRPGHETRGLVNANSLVR